MGLPAISLRQHSTLAWLRVQLEFTCWAEPALAKLQLIKKVQRRLDQGRPEHEWGEGMFYNLLVGECLRRQTNPIGPLPQASFNLYLAFPFSVIEYIIYFGQQLPHVAFRTTTISF